MDEQFLHYIWKFQNFENGDLKTTENQPLIILNQGNHNHDSGPDFEEARIKIEDVEWAGSIEIHVNSSDWEKHNHSTNKSYDNVILHVVWENDKPVYLGKEPIPTLELHNIIDYQHFEKYRAFLSQHKEILCEDSLESISDINFNSTLDRMMVERLEQKSKFIFILLEETNQDWEIVTYLSLANNFGFSLNKEPFLMLARSLPLRIISKNQQQSKRIEALVFGQAGFLEGEADSYKSELQSEYEYLKTKHQLKSKLTRQMWKFGRMRPSNFPTVRLAQFSSLLGYNEHLFSNLIEVNDPKELIDTFQINLSEYWVKHYDFGKPKKKEGQNIGKTTQENLLINTVAPLLAAYGRYTNDQSFIDRAVQILERIPPENNKIIKKWAAVNKNPKNAFDSQALIGLYKNYCAKKKCLNCAIGAEILAR